VVIFGPSQVGVFDIVEVFGDWKVMPPHDAKARTKLDFNPLAFVGASKLQIPIFAAEAELA
jgi:hypothetical protein